MAVEVIIPKVDMDMESAAIQSWKVGEGDRVEAGDVLFEITTNKAAMEVEAPASGIVRGIAATDHALPVGSVVAWICQPEEQPPCPSLADTGQTASANPPATVSLEREGAVAGLRTASGVRATPLARRLAKEARIDLSLVTGSGPRGRIVGGDVERYACAPQSAASVASPLVAEAQPTANGARVQRLPMTTVQKLAARRLTESVRNAPQFTMSAHIDMQALIDLRRRVAERIELLAGTRPSLTVLIARIVGHLLPHHARLNSSVEGDEVCLHEDVNIGIAMDRDGELMVPVLKQTDRKPLAVLTREFALLQEQVRARTVKPADLAGGTFTISNLGMYGVDAFTAIVNPPESAILAVGRTLDAPAGRDGRIVLVPRATFTLSCDHRIVDGVVAARFMRDLREAVEHPEVLI
jgi:pyruvate dehydrogenase E2 component (dihydrolipoamide acetyltransferase)